MKVYFIKELKKLNNKELYELQQSAEFIVKKAYGNDFLTKDETLKELEAKVNEALDAETCHKAYLYWLEALLDMTPIAQEKLLANITPMEFAKLLKK